MNQLNNIDKSQTIDLILDQLISKKKGLRFQKVNAKGDFEGISLLNWFKDRVEEFFRGRPNSSSTVVLRKRFFQILANAQRDQTLSRINIEKIQKAAYSLGITSKFSRKAIDALIKSIVQGTLTLERASQFEEAFSGKYAKKLALLSKKIRGVADPIFSFPSTSPKSSPQPLPQHPDGSLKNVPIEGSLSTRQGGLKVEPQEIDVEKVDNKVKEVPILKSDDKQINSNGIETDPPLPQQEPKPLVSHTYTTLMKGGLLALVGLVATYAYSKFTKPEESPRIETGISFAKEVKVEPIDSAFSNASLVFSEASHSNVKHVNASLENNEKCYEELVFSRPPPHSLTSTNLSVDAPSSFTSVPNEEVKDSEKDSDSSWMDPLSAIVGIFASVFAYFKFKKENAPENNEDAPENNRDLNKRESNLNRSEKNESLAALLDSRTRFAEEFSNIELKSTLPFAKEFIYIDFNRIRQINKESPLFLESLSPELAYYYIKAAQLDIDLSPFERQISPEKLACMNLALSLQEDSSKISEICNLPEDKLSIIAPYLTHIDKEFGKEFIVAVSELSFEKLSIIAPYFTHLNIFVKEDLDPDLKVNFENTLKTLHLEKLKIKAAQNLKLELDLSELHFCKEIEISNLFNSFLPEFSKCLKKFKCKGCLNLHALPFLSNCQELKIQDCENLKHIPDLPECTSLIVLKCKNLNEIGSLQKCETLTCEGHENLSKIGILSPVVNLNCDGCVRLKSIGLAEDQRMLNQALGGTQVYYSTFSHLKCSSLPDQVRRLPYTMPGENRARHEFPVHLAELKVAPKKILMLLAEYLNKNKAFPKIVFTEGGKGNRSVGSMDLGGLGREFISSIFENLFLDLRKPEVEARKLKWEMEVEKISAEQIHLRADEEELNAKEERDRIEEENLKIKAKNAESFEEEEFQKEIIRIEGERLRNQEEGERILEEKERLNKEIHRAHTELEIAQKEFRKIPYPFFQINEDENQNYLPVYFKKLGKALPVCQTTHRAIQEQIICLCTIGKLFIYSYKNSSFTTGIRFDNFLFETIASLLKVRDDTLKAISEGNISKISDDLYIQLYTSLFESMDFLMDAIDPSKDLNDKELVEKLQIFLPETDLNKFLPKTDLEKNQVFSYRKDLAKEIRAEIQSNRLNETEHPFESIVLAAAIITRSMREEVEGAEWVKIQQLKGEELRSKIEGELTAHSILASLTYDNKKAFVFDGENYNYIDPGGVPQIGWLKNWIEQANRQNLEKFVRALTGSSTITNNTLLKIQLKSDNSLPTWITCLSMIKLSQNCDSETKFISMLEESLENAVGFTLE